MRFADPRTDFAFKKIFGNENAKDVLISFLNAVLALDEKHAIVDVTLLNPYEAPKTKYMRDSFLDVQGVRYNNLDNWIILRNQFPQHIRKMWVRCFISPPKCRDVRGVTFIVDLFHCACGRSRNDSGKTG
ncbi:MAG: PD-(D/E)XK nuclease family transposase [bacterium]